MPQIDGLETEVIKRIADSIKENLATQINESGRISIFIQPNIKSLNEQILYAKSSGMLLNEASEQVAQEGRYDLSEIIKQGVVGSIIAYTIRYKKLQGAAHASM